MSLLLHKEKNIIEGVYTPQVLLPHMPPMLPDTSIQTLLPIPEQIPPIFANARQLDDGSWIVYLDEEKKAEMCSITYRCIRERRNRLLAECDWRMMADSPLSPEEREAWQNYRHALRNFPAQCDPLCIIWPVAPDGSS